MGLDYQKGRDFSKYLIDSYVQSSGDQDVIEVLDFCKCYRAYMRGEVESFRLDDPNIPQLGRRRRSKGLAGSFASPMAMPGS
jgi:aminoglycoside phosphotransferase family enzyme